MMTTLMMTRLKNILGCRLSFSLLAALPALCFLTGAAVYAAPPSTKDLHFQKTNSGAKPTQAPPQTSSSVGGPVRDKWALIVGISRFQNPQISLRYAAKDAQDFYQYLTTKGNFAADHVKILTNEQATQRRILSELGDRWLPRVAAPEDLVVIYISSHGSSSDIDVDADNFIVAYDTDPNDLYTTGLDMQDLARIIKRRVHAKRVAVFLDACHAGAVTPDAKGLTRTPRVDANQISQGSGQLVICSSQSSQASWELKDLPNSVFTKYLIQGLQLNGPNTRLSQAFKYMAENVQNTVLRERGVLQNPVLRSQWNGDELVVAAKPQAPVAGLTEEEAGRDNLPSAKIGPQTDQTLMPTPVPLNLLTLNSAFGKAKPGFSGYGASNSAMPSPAGAAPPPPAAAPPMVAAIPAAVPVADCASSPVRAERPLVADASVTVNAALPEVASASLPVGAAPMPTMAVAHARQPFATQTAHVVPSHSVPNVSSSSSSALITTDGAEQILLIPIQRATKEMATPVAGKDYWGVVKSRSEFANMPAIIAADIAKGLSLKRGIPVISPPVDASMDDQTALSMAAKMKCNYILRVVLDTVEWDPGMMSNHYLIGISGSLYAFDTGQWMPIGQREFRKAPGLGDKKGGRQYFEENMAPIAAHYIVEEVQTLSFSGHHKSH